MATSPIKLTTVFRLYYRKQYTYKNIWNDTEKTYFRAEYMPNNPAELIPTANPIIKPTLTRSKQLGGCGLCIFNIPVLLMFSLDQYPVKTIDRFLAKF